MDKEKVLILKSELKAGFKRVEELYQKIEEKRPIFRKNEEGIESMAYKLHNLYGAYEEIFEIVASFFENQIEEVRYHTNLLQRMKIEIEGIRPAFISEETHRLLDELRRFRHLFRHAYDVKLDGEQIARILNIALKLKTKFIADLENFLKTLEEK